MGRQWEPRVPHTPGPAVAMPDGVLMLTDTVLAFDHVAHRIKITTHVRPVEHGSVEAAYEAAVARLMEIVARLRAPLPEAAITPVPPVFRTRSVNSNVTREQYEAAVERIRQ